MSGVLKTLREASGDLTAGETSLEVDTVFGRAAVFLDITKLTLAAVDDEVDFYIQASYDKGENWVDVENIHFDNADNGASPKKVAGIGVGEFLAADLAADATDGTLADDTKKKLPLGAKLRIKTAVTGATAPTYAYSATAWFY